MQVQVKDGLTGAGTYVIDRTITILNAALARDLRRDQLAIPQQLCVCILGFLEPDNVLFGDYQHMDGGLWIDVFESKTPVIFVDLLGRNSAGDDLTEKAISHNSEIVTKTPGRAFSGVVKSESQG
jgi:hypothetical protein